MSTIAHMPLKCLLIFYQLTLFIGSLATCDIYVISICQALLGFVYELVAMIKANCPSFMPTPRVDVVFLVFNLPN